MNINDVPQAIQMALVPAFLLTGIAGTLNVMTGRLARIVDRGRSLVERRPPDAEAEQASVMDELRNLEIRRRHAGAAISFGTLSALLVCMVIAALFLEVMLDVSLKWLIGSLFTGTTLSLVAGLSFFLREVQLATRTVRIPIPGARP